MQVPGVSRCAVGWVATRTRARGFVASSMRRRAPTTNVIGMVAGARATSLTQKTRGVGERCSPTPGQVGEQHGRTVIVFWSDHDWACRPS